MPHHKFPIGNPYACSIEVSSPLERNSTILWRWSMTLVFHPLCPTMAHISVLWHCIIHMLQYGPSILYLEHTGPSRGHQYGPWDWTIFRSWGRPLILDFEHQNVWHASRCGTQMNEVPSTTGNASLKLKAQTVTVFDHMGVGGARLKNLINA